MRGSQQVVATLAIVQLEEGRAVLLPAVRRLVGFGGDQAREVHLLRAHRVHLLADDVLDLAQRAQAERQPRVDAGRSAANVAGTHQKLVRVDLGVGRVFTQGSQEESREISKHAPRVRHTKALGPPAQPWSPSSRCQQCPQMTARAPSSRSRAPG